MFIFGIKSYLHNMKKKNEISLGVLLGNELLYTKSMGFVGHFLYNTKTLCYFFPIVPKMSDHIVINAPKINAEESVNVLSRKLHSLENCYIWGKAIVGTAKIFPSTVICSLAHDKKILLCPHGMITIT